MNKKNHKILAQFFVLFCSTILFAQQQTAPSNLLLVLDASGSMWGQIQGKNKIVIARQVLKDVLGGLPADARVGLVAYGHRSEGDCEDIELIAPLTAGHTDALTKKIDSLNPKGKTPITGAIRKALESLADDGQPTTIVLVSDGLETCGGDPCALVRDAKESGASFIMHVVGFDIGEVDVSQLECTAQAGGGLYFNAQNADDLAAALDKSVAMPADLPAASLAVEALVDGQLEDVLIKVFDQQSGQVMAQGRTYSSAATNPRYIALPPGTYRIDVDAIRMRGNVQQSVENIAIIEGDTTHKVIDFSTGELAVTITRNGELSDASVRVYHAGTNEQVAAGRTYRGAKTNPRKFRITPGKYDVKIKALEINSGPEMLFQNVAIAARQNAEISHDFETGTLKVGAQHGGALVDAVVKVIHVDTGEQVGQGRTYTSEKTNPRTFELAPGTYRVELHAIKLPGGPKKNLNLTVAAGKTTTGTVEFE